MAANANIKISVDSTELDAKLSRAMKDLGVYHDSYGRLVNKEGQFVSGLSQSKIRMGDYIDSLGQMRNANDQLIEGLSATQQKMRMYLDDMSNIRSAEGDFVGFSRDKLAAIDAETKAKLDQVQRESEARAAMKSGDADWTASVRTECQKRMEAILNESARRKSEAEKQLQVEQEMATRRQEVMEAEAQQKKAEQAMSTILGTGANMVGQFTSIVALVAKTNEGVSSTGKFLAVAGNAGSTFLNTMKIVSTIVRNYQDLRNAMAAATVAQQVLNAVSGNWITLVIGGSAAAVAGYATYASMTSDGVKSTSKMVDATDKLALAWLRVEKEINNARYSLEGAMKAGALSTTMTMEEQRDELLKQLAELKKVESQLQDKYLETGTNWLTLNKEVRQRDWTSFTTGFYSDYRGDINVGHFKKYYDSEFGGVNGDFYRDLETKSKQLSGLYSQVIERYKTQMESEKIEADRIFLTSHLIELRKNEVGNAKEIAIVEAALKGADKKLEEARQKEQEQASKYFATNNNLIDFEAERIKIYATSNASLEDMQAAEGRLKKAYEEQEEKLAKQTAIDKGWGKWINKSGNEVSNPKTQSEFDAAVKQAGKDLGVGTELYVFAIKNLTEEFNKTQTGLAKTELDKLGFNQYLSLGFKKPETQEQLDETITLWTEKAKAAGISTTDLTTAINNITEEFNNTVADKRVKQSDKEESLVSSWGLHQDETLRERYSNRLVALEHMLSKQEITEEGYARIKESLKKQLEKDEEEAKKRERDKKDQEKAQGRSKLGIDRLLEQTVSPEDEYKNTLKNINEALEKHWITSRDKKQAIIQAEKEYAESLQKAKKDRLSSLGLSSYLNNIKTDYEKFNESLNNLQIALKEGLLSNEEAWRVQEKIYDDFNKIGEESKDNPQEKIAAYTPPESMTAGSSALYSAMTQRNNSYQNRVQKFLSGIEETNQVTSNAITELQRQIENIGNRIGAL